MTELKATEVKTYTISGFTFKDIELICLGLDGMNDCEFDMVDRKQELTKVMDDVLPDIGKIS